MTLTIEAPDRTVEQRREALAKANEIRFWRSAVKDNMTREVAARLVLNPPSMAVSWKLLKVLLAIPQVGDARAAQWMLRLRVSPSKTLGGLTDRQRGEIADLLRG